MRRRADSNCNNTETGAKTRAIGNGAVPFRVHADLNSKSIYLDFNATTPLAPSVLDAIYATLKYAWGNPSSSYKEGRMAKEIIDESRSHVARMIGGFATEIVFTSGGTEANNMVFHSVIRNFKRLSAESQAQNMTCERPHVITSNIEHDSVILALMSWEKAGEIELTEVPVSKKTGQVNVEDVMLAIKQNTVLVSIMFANNETGVIQPIEKISESVRIKNISRQKDNLPRVYLHTDAAQAIGKIPVDSSLLNVDYLTIVGHKFYGPRIGALFVHKLGTENSSPLFPIFYGGGQERNYRPGTENTGMIAGLGEACRLVTENLDSYMNHMQKARDYLENQLEIEFRGCININNRFKCSRRLPNTCNVSILGKNLQGRKVLAAAKYLQASVGAACHSNNGDKPSHILTACGIPEEIAKNALRLSIGRETTENDIDLVVQDLKDAVVGLVEKVQQLQVDKEKVDCRIMPHAMQDPGT
eukprot:gene1711-16192_t